MSNLFGCSSTRQNPRSKTLKSLAFFNNKGGVGKTTLLCNVAAFFSKEMQKKVCVIDCDPQCNASQYFFEDHELELFLEDEGKNIETLFSRIMKGEGHTDFVPLQRSEAFGVDVLCGSPGLSMAEDFLAEEWARLNTHRGLSSNLVFTKALKNLEAYDYVFFDVSPSLGAINRTVLLSSDYFISPMSIDIFSLKAFENISRWMSKWTSTWNYSINNPQLDVKSDLMSEARDVKPAKFIGYVSQQYIAKRDPSGERRPVKSYDEIIKQIDGQIRQHFSDTQQPPTPFEIGKIPNLHSLAPMSQSKRKPIFGLGGRDGIVGAHFAKVKESKDIFANVANEIIQRVV